MRRRKRATLVALFRVLLDKLMDAGDSGGGVDLAGLYQFALTTPQTYHDTFSCVDPRPSFPRKRESIDPGEGEYGVIIHNWYYTNSF